MPVGLERRQTTGQLHFITFSCHHRRPYLQDPETKHTLEQVIERTRRSHDLILYAYVLMPEHVHLLLSGFVAEPKTMGTNLLPAFTIAGEHGMSM